MTSSHNIRRNPDVSTMILGEGLVRYTDGTGYSEPLPTSLGFVGTGFQFQARNILVQVNQMEYVEHVVY